MISRCQVSEILRCATQHPSFLLYICKLVLLICATKSGSELTFSCCAVAESNLVPVARLPNKPRLSKLTEALNFGHTARHGGEDVELA